MNMDRSSLVVALRASLQDTAARLDDKADLDRMLDLAAMDLGRVRPRTRLGTATLSAGVAEYVAPADLIQVGAPLWGLELQRALAPWESGWPGRLPELSTIETDQGLCIRLTPAPLADQITRIGAEYRFYYRSGHRIGDTAADTSVLPDDAGLLLLRAQAEAMKEMAARGVSKPVQLRDGRTQGLRNASPAALYDQLMREFEGQARR